MAHSAPHPLLVVLAHLLLHLFALGGIGLALRLQLRVALLQLGLLLRAFLGILLAPLAALGEVLLGLRAAVRVIGAEGLVLRARLLALAGVLFAELTAGQRRRTFVLRERDASSEQQGGEGDREEGNSDSLRAHGAPPDGIPSPPEDNNPRDAGGLRQAIRRSAWALISA